jgi:hypothetical protein
MDFAQLQKNPIKKNASYIFDKIIRENGEDEADDDDSKRNERTNLLNKSSSDSRRLPGTPSKYDNYNYGSELRSFSASPRLRNVNTPIGDEGDLTSINEMANDTKEKKLFRFIRSVFGRPASNLDNQSDPVYFRNNKSKTNSSKSHLTDFYYKYSKYFNILKKTILISYCILCIVIFSLHEDKKVNEWVQSTISNEAIGSFECVKGSGGGGSSNHIKHRPFNLNTQDQSEQSNRLSEYFRLEIFGPFIPEEELSQSEMVTKHLVKLDVYDKNDQNNRTNSLFTWKLYIEKLENSYKSNQIAGKVIKLEKMYKQSELVIKIATDLSGNFPFNYKCSQLSQQYGNSILYSALLLVFVYGLIIFELTHRSLAAGMGALGGVAMISLVDTERPSLNTIATWVEWETILLMFGMMIIVALFCETGFFDLIAVRIFHHSGSRIWIMISSLCFLAAFLSAFLDNVTTILLLTPITIRLCEVMNLDPRMIIIAEVIFSNIGGTSTVFRHYFIY